MSSRWTPQGFSLKNLLEKQRPEPEPLNGKKLQPMMRALRTVHSALDELNLDRQRQAQDLLGRLAAPMLGLEWEPFDIDGLPSAWVRPERGHSRKYAILYCHGGGFMSGSLNYARIMASKLASATGYDTMVFEYRLAPEFPFPSPLEDALRAWDYLMRLGYGARDVVVAGESAGGNLVLSLTLKLKEQKRKLPRALVCMSPWTDLTGEDPSRAERADTDPMLTQEYLESAVRAYSRGHDLKDPLLSPLFGDLSGFPPVYLQAGENEILYGDCLRLYQKLLEAQSPCRLDVWEGMWHLFQLFPIRKAGEAVSAVSRFLLDL